MTPTDDRHVGTDPPLVQATGIRKSFGGVEVLHGVDLTASAGSILALLGENGAGKSTLVKILAGDYQPDGGEIRIGGEEVDSLTPALARDLGLRMIFQELADAPTLSVAENICLGQWPQRRGMVDWAEMHRRAREALQTLGADIDLRRRAGALRVGERQIVEVARALLGDARCMILDEPTAALSASEAQRLFDYLGRLRDAGVAIIYITHRLDEVQRIADRVQVLRDGSTVLDRPVAGLEREQLVTAMVGHELIRSTRSELSKESLGAVPVLRLRNASSAKAFAGIDLDLHQHEVLALYGKVGSGVSEVAETLYGARPLDTGTMAIGDDEVRLRGPADAVQHSIGLLPGDRQREGGFMKRSVAENLCAPSWSRLSRHGWMTAKSEARAYRVWHERLHIRSRDEPTQTLATLSGGNQQKVLLGRWLERAVRIVLLIEPTRGVDVGAREEIYRAIRELTDRGVAVLVASSDHEEVSQLADRVAVMVRGRITQRIAGRSITPAELVAAAGGGDV
jgi:ribose transport system ATP-binding protein